MRFRWMAVGTTAALLMLLTAAPVAADSVGVSWEWSLSLLPVETTGVDVEVEWGEHHLSDETVMDGGLGDIHLALDLRLSVDRPEVSTGGCEQGTAASAGITGVEADAVGLLGARNADGGDTVHVGGTALEADVGGVSANTPCLGGSQPPTHDEGGQRNRGSAERQNGCDTGEGPGNDRGRSERRCDQWGRTNAD